MEVCLPCIQLTRFNPQQYPAQGYSILYVKESLMVDSGDPTYYWGLDEINRLLKVTQAASAEQTGTGWLTYIFLP